MDCSALLGLGSGGQQAHVSEQHMYLLLEQSEEYALRSRLTNDPDAFKCWRSAGGQDLGEPVMEDLCWTGCWLGSCGLSFASDGGYETMKSGKTMD